MNIKQFIKSNNTTKKIYLYLKNKKTEKDRNDRVTYHGKFIDRKKDCEKMCMVLAGYKEFSYPAVFGRLAEYIEADIDVCIITSGKWSDKIDELCRNNNWSYLSTEENDVSLVQNVAIMKHPNAKYIFKLDEDIFLTRNYFSKMFVAYKKAELGEYNPGVIAPLIPINGFGYFRILNKLGIVAEYEDRFGKAKYSTTPNDPIQSSPNVAKFMWGDGGIVPNIDVLNSMFEHEGHGIVACPIRFSIGAILFKRSLWEDMNYFRVVKGTNSLGVDEADMCNFCCFNSRPLLVTEDTVVGHLSFGPQNVEMKQYYEKHTDVFLKRMSDEL